MRQWGTMTKAAAQPKRNLFLFFFFVGRGSKKRQRNKLATTSDDWGVQRGVEVDKLQGLA